MKDILLTSDILTELRNHDQYELDLIINEKKKEKLGKIGKRCNFSSEIMINRFFYNFTKQYIKERIDLSGSLPYTDALNEIVYLAQEKFGHGSEQTVRRYINQLTCRVADYQVIRDQENKKQIIRRKTEFLLNNEG